MRSSMKRIYQEAASSLLRRGSSVERLIGARGTKSVAHGGLRACLLETLSTTQPSDGAFFVTARHQRAQCALLRSRVTAIQYSRAFLCRSFDYLLAVPCIDRRNSILESVHSLAARRTRKISNGALGEDVAFVIRHDATLVDRLR